MTAERPITAHPSAMVPPPLSLAGDRELVQVTYYPVLKNRALGRRLTRVIPARRGENPVNAAERELRRRYKVRDFVIFDAYLAQTGFWDRTAPAPDRE